MYRFIILLFSALIFFSPSTLTANEKTLILQRDNLKPYSLAEIILAVMEKPDFIELPFVLTSDDIPIVYGDVFLQPQTNVADIFPTRKREDEKYYVIDFTWDELQQLTFTTKRDEMYYSGGLVNYNEAAGIIEIINKHLDSSVAILPLVKFPWFHLNENKDISSIVLRKAISFSGSADKTTYLKCFDPDELKRIHKTILPGLLVDIKLVQGIDNPAGRETMRKRNGQWISYNYDWLFTRVGIRLLSGYAFALHHSDLTIAEESVLLQSIEDSKSLGMNVFVDINQAQPATSLDMQYEKVLSIRNIDGIGLYSMASFRSYQNKKTHAEEDTLLPTEKDSSNNAATILSDPDALSRRLEELNKNGSNGSNGSLQAE